MSWSPIRGGFCKLWRLRRLNAVIRSWTTATLRDQNGCMNRFVSALLLSFVSSYGLCQSQEGKCWQAAQAQTEMNRCADLDARKADDDLNHVYRALLSKRKNDETATKELRSAQRAWVAFRDARMRELFPAKEKQREYGSMYPMCYIGVATEMTKERTAQLRRMLDDEDPCGISSNGDDANRGTSTAPSPRKLPTDAVSNL